LCVFMEVDLFPCRRLVAEGDFDSIAIGVTAGVCLVVVICGVALCYRARYAAHVAAYVTTLDSAKVSSSPTQPYTQGVDVCKLENNFVATQSMSAALAETKKVSFGANAAKQNGQASVPKSILKTGKDSEGGYQARVNQVAVGQGQGGRATQLTVRPVVAGASPGYPGRDPSSPSPKPGPTAVAVRGPYVTSGPYARQAVQPWQQGPYPRVGQVGPYPRQFVQQGPYARQAPQGVRPSVVNSSSAARPNASRTSASSAAVVSKTAPYKQGPYRGTAESRPGPARQAGPYSRAGNGQTGGPAVGGVQMGGAMPRNGSYPSRGRQPKGGYPGLLHGTAPPVAAGRGRGSRIEADASWNVPDQPRVRFG